MAQKISKINVGTSDMHSVKKALKAVGAVIIESVSTPGAVGYTTITISSKA